MEIIAKSGRAIVFGALCVSFLSALATPAAGAAQRIVSGKWESAMTTDGATRTVSYCISAEEAASINGDSRSGREFAEKKAQKAGSTCAIKSYEIKGDTGSYSLACGSRTITDTTTYHDLSRRNLRGCQDREQRGQDGYDPPQVAAHRGVPIEVTGSEASS